MDRDLFTNGHRRKAERVVTLDMPLAINSIVPPNVLHPGQLAGIVDWVDDLKFNLQLLGWELEANMTAPVRLASTVVMKN